MFPVVGGICNAVALLHESDVPYLGHRQYNMFGRNVKVQ